MYLVTYIYTHMCVCVCKNKEKGDYEFETEQEVESTAETLEGGKGMGKLYYNLKKTKPKFNTKFKSKQQRMYSQIPFLFHSLPDYYLNQTTINFHKI